MNYELNSLAHFLQGGAAGNLQLTQEQADDWAEDAHLMLCILHNRTDIVAAEI